MTAILVYRDVPVRFECPCVAGRPRCPVVTVNVVRDGVPEVMRSRSRDRRIRGGRGRGNGRGIRGGRCRNRRPCRNGCRDRYLQSIADNFRFSCPLAVYLKLARRRRRRQATAIGCDIFPVRKRRFRRRRGWSNSGGRGHCWSRGYSRGICGSSGWGGCPVRFVVVQPRYPRLELRMYRRRNTKSN